MKKYSCYEYEVNKYLHCETCGYYETKLYKEGYDYKIKTTGCYPYDDGIIDSDEWYDTETQADQAAKEHIDRLENGER